MGASWCGLNESRKDPDNPNMVLEDVPRYLQMTDTTNNYIYLKPKKEHRFSLIWLHGMGQTAKGVVDLFKNPNQSIVPDTCKVIMPTAPTRTLSTSGKTEPSWFDMLPGQKANQNDIRVSVRMMTELIDREVQALGGQHDKVYICGFFQGCAIALSTFLLYRDG